LFFARTFLLLLLLPSDSDSDSAVDRHAEIFQRTQKTDQAVLLFIDGIVSWAPRRLDSHGPAA
jgi:hypothetical protein